MTGKVVLLAGQAHLDVGSWTPNLLSFFAHDTVTGR